MKNNVELICLYWSTSRNFPGEVGQIGRPKETSARYDKEVQ
jgi:hypothetical protein